MSSQPSGSKRKRFVGSASQNLLHPGEWTRKRARSGSPSTRGATTLGTESSNSPAHSNLSSRSPSPIGRLGSSNVSANTHVQPPDAVSQDSKAKSRIPNASSSSKGSAWTGLEQALRALRVTTKICPPLSTAIEELISCLPMFEAAAKNHRDYDELAAGLERMVDQLVRHLNGTTSEAIINTINNIANAIRKEIASIDVQQSRSLPRRMLGASSTEDDLIRRYRRIEQLFRQLQGEASMSTWNTVDELRVDQQLKDLRPAALARFNSKLSTEVSRRACTKHTRTTILDESMAWSEDPDLAKVYWINGMAGTGKTTIAYTLCQRLEAGKQLAASFFCTRASPECRDAERIIPTIAYQLARRFTPFRYSLCQKLKQDPDISTGQLSDQFDQLLKQPLLAATDKLPNNLVIVVDALDECSDPHIVELFLNLLFCSVMELPIKFFITSRPEPAIRNKMMPESERSRSILYLHEIERSLVQADIELYLREELALISPTDEDISELAEHAGSLFIYAATAVRHIRPVGRAVNSKARLQAILAASTESTISLSAIDALYIAILTDAIHDQELTSEEQSQMLLVLHTAICAREPLLIQMLSALCGMDNKETVLAALQPLRSVLHVSDHIELVTTLHASFSDFMFDHERSGVFYCDKAEHSRFLSEICFIIMRAQLRFNICSLQSSFIPNAQVSKLGERIDTNISNELLYACRFWMEHLNETDPRPTLLALVDDFMSQRLLFWMEVMSLKNYMVFGIIVMSKLSRWLTQVHQNTRQNLSELASDAQAFVTLYASSPASAYTPHIYLSALPLTSPSNAVRSQYLPQFKGLIKVSGTSFNGIGKATLAIWPSKHPIRSSVLSPDGDRLVLGDEEGEISVRNAYAGNYIVQHFKAHRSTIASLGISGDGMHIVSGSHDMTLSVWSIQDGSLTAGPFKGHTDRVNSVAFSPNAALLVSGSSDRIVGIWDSHSACIPMRPFTGHAKGVESVGFSPDGSRVVSGSADNPIRVWDVSNGTTIFVLEGYLEPVLSVQFSRNGAHIISGSYDSTVHIYNTSDGTFFSQPLKGYFGQITSMAISPEGDCIVSGSWDHTVHLWDTHSGQLIAGPFEGHTNIVGSVSFSGEGVRVVSTSDDKTVRVWNSHARVLHIERVPKYWSRHDSLFAFSSNQTHVAFCDRTEIHIWDLRTITHIIIPTYAGIEHLQFSLDGSRIHSLHWAGTLCTWDTQTANLLDGPHNCSMLGHWDSAACSADGTRIVFCHKDRATLWHVNPNQSKVLPRVHHDFEEFCATFSENGSRFATVDRYLSEVWDGESGARVAGPFLCSDRFACLSIDGTYLCCRSESTGLYELINTNTKEKTSIHSDSAPVFTPGGLHVVGKCGGFVHIWDMLGQMVASVEFPFTATGLEGSALHGYSSDGWLLLSYNRKEGRYICRTRINYPPFAPSPDGWILNHKKQHLFWVPFEIREDFLGCNGVVISERNEVIQCVNDDGMLVGDDWSQCYVPSAYPM